MSTLKHVEPEDLMLYAMRLLGPAETAAIEAHLDQSAAARRELAEIQGDLALYAMTAEPAEPAPQTRTRFLRQLSEEKRATPVRVPQTVVATPEPTVTPIDSYRPSRTETRRSVSARILPWVGWAAAAGFAITTTQFYRERQTLRETVAANQRQLDATTAQADTARDVLGALNDQTAKRVVLTHPGTAATPTGRTTWSAKKGILIFTASNLAPVDTFKVYELWLIPADGSAPIPAGTFHPDAHGFASLVSTDMPKGVEAKAFGITVEDDGGSKTPTLPILLAGT